MCGKEDGEKKGVLIVVKQFGVFGQTEWWKATWRMDKVQEEEMGQKSLVKNRTVE